MNGTSKKLTDRGFWFITAEGEEKDIFFNNSSLKGVTFEELQEGDAVTFDMEDTDKGPSAINVAKA